VVGVAVKVTVALCLKYSEHWPLSAPVVLLAQLMPEGELVTLPLAVLFVTLSSEYAPLLMLSIVAVPVDPLTEVDAVAAVAPVEAVPLPPPQAASTADSIAVTAKRGPHEKSTVLKG
jgi:hypothetical protein